LGLGVVVTVHGPDDEREKFRGFGAQFLRFGRQVGLRYAHRVIFVADHLSKRVSAQTGIEGTVIPNGVATPTLLPPGTNLKRFGLTPNRYVLLVGRMDPAKRHLDLIEGFSMAALEGWKLVIVGAAEHPDHYTTLVRESGSKRSDVVLAGFQAGESLAELYSNAGMFVLPSAQEGHPIVLLEALSYGCPTLASNIQANLEVGLDPSAYFSVGNTREMANKIRSLSSRADSRIGRDSRREWIASRFSWDRVARETSKVLDGVIGGTG
jgi:glycosyltransferase involved in cell wall biosynthesis